LSTPKKLRDQVVSKARRSGVTVLMSHHDFSKTPPAEVLAGTLDNIARAGCDLAKLVTFAKSTDDAFRMLDFFIQIQKATPVPVIAFAMGDVGRITRLVAPIFGSPIVYAAAGAKTAPGQLDVATTKRLLQELTPEEVKS
ncbi:MAG: type I 3-dehydroquinate dehydratase, partial [Candidatus Hodarchaeaceae archaeon]|nr:type I 3-dehydroquinate dehydratase [Candidatus Hodarchaeaceae archaeon]